ncbi:MAG: carbohydrate ABC transporter substrate-binding protein, partial [Catenulispora sp.]
MNAKFRAIGAQGTGNRGAAGRRRRRTGLLAVGAILALGAAACSSSTNNTNKTGTAPGSTSAPGGFKSAEQTGGTLTVWVDSTRLAAAQAYQKLHPEVKMDIVTYDGDANGSNYLQTKVSLFNRTGSGWPDVVFSSQNNEAAWAVSAGFTAPLNKGLIPQATLDGWAKNANAPCTVDGTIYCLRNDLSQTVP